MTNQEILEKLSEKKGEANDDKIKERLDNIINMLHLMPIDIKKEVPGIITYLDGRSSSLADDLDSILFRLKELVSKNSATAKKGKKNKKFNKSLKDGEENKKTDKTENGGNREQNENTEVNEENKLINFFQNNWFPLLVSVIVLAVGLILGLTVFHNNQDPLYFTLESIKDIVGSLVSGFFAKECVNQKQDKRNSTVIVIVASIVGLIAFVFSIILILGSNIFFIERFTQWGKLTYLWLIIGIIIIAIICAVSVVWYMLTKYYSSEESNKEKT